MSNYSPIPALTHPSDEVGSVARAAWQRLTDYATCIDIPVNAKITALTLRQARLEGPAVYQYVMGLALARRRARLIDETLTQRRWQASVSRRPQRGRHHDSWAIRERYVRCNPAYGY